MAREVFSKEMTFKLGPKCYGEASYSKIWMKRHLDRVKSRKNPKVEMKLVYGIKQQNGQPSYSVVSGGYCGGRDRQGPCGKALHDMERSVDFKYDRK